MMESKVYDDVRMEARVVMNTKEEEEERRRGRIKGNQSRGAVG